MHVEAKMDAYMYTCVHTDMYKYMIHAHCVYF